MDECYNVPVLYDCNDSAACCSEPTYNGADSTAKQAVSGYQPNKDELLATIESQNKRIIELNELLKCNRTALAEAQHRLSLCGTFMTSFKEMATSILNNA